MIAMIITSTVFVFMRLSGVLRSLASFAFNYGLCASAPVLSARTDRGLRDR